MLCLLERLPRLGAFGLFAEGVASALFCTRSQLPISAACHFACMQGLKKHEVTWSGLQKQSYNKDKQMMSVRPCNAAGASSCSA